MRVRYTDRARSDLDKIHAYIHERNPRAAATLTGRIRNAVDRLGEWPYIGHVGRVAGTLEWVVAPSPYIVVYRVDETAREITIIAVFHGAQYRG
jgi:addiction module RelE/StbE family toxin